ncbi:MAG: hypothetical protein GXO96_05760 [Nitrospirae bacterium]|nr:hypothetical protein [Candidatus Manganitrophaceae bacterium]
MLLFSCGKETGADITGERSRLTQNRAKWDVLASNDYAFYFREPVGPAGNNRVLIQVISKQVQNLSPSPAVGENTFSISPDSRILYPTMEALFDQISNTLDQNPVFITVNYSSVHGNPTRIRYDLSNQTITDERLIRTEIAWVR